MTIHDLYRPFQRFFRTRRMRRFWRQLHLEPATRILDVGGDPFNWSLLAERPQVVYLNRYGLVGLPNWIVADGCCLPFQDGTFDIVYSNSVIEHLATWQRQVSFADECRRVGRGYYVQTPNKWFPVEPHLITPFVHWLPRRLLRPTLRSFTLWGLFTKPTRQDCDNFMNEIRLLDVGELHALFPDGQVWRERFLGLTKSVIVVRPYHHVSETRLVEESGGIDV